MFARARFLAGSQDLLTVPLGAIVPQGQLSTVFVVPTDQRARMRVVDTVFVARTGLKYSQASPPASG
jgi:hypothetical protein